jgi:uncharacterized protein (DUF58 family)
MNPAAFLNPCFKRLRFPVKTKLTLTAWLFLVFNLFLLSCFFWQSHSLSFAFGLVLLFCWPISYWLGRRSLSGLQLKWVLPQQVLATEKCYLGIVLHSAQASTFLKVNIGHGRNSQQITVSQIDRQGTPLYWPLRFDKRGWHNLPAVTVECQQPFGLLSMTRELNSDEALLVYPQMGHFTRRFDQKFESLYEEGRLNSPIGNDEFSHLRSFRQGDNFKQINWKATARSGQLWVSQKHALTSKTLFIYIDLQVSPVKRRLFETQLSFAATLIQELKPRGWNICLTGPFAPKGIHGNADRLLSTLAGLKTKSNEGPLNLLAKDRPCLLISSREQKDPEQFRGVIRVSDLDKWFSL